MRNTAIGLNFIDTYFRSGLYPTALPSGLGSEAAGVQGTRNYMGARDPAIDAMIAAMLEAREHPAFVSAVRALDRVLMSGSYVIPLFSVQEQWIARWNRIERPKATALSGYLPETWWQRPERQPK